MKMSDAISQMIENSSAIIVAVRRDIEEGRIVGADAAKAMAQVAKSQSLILKAIENQRQLWRERQRRHRATPSEDRPIL